MSPVIRRQHKRSRSKHHKRLRFFAYVGLTLVILAIVLVLIGLNATYLIH